MQILLFGTINCYKRARIYSAAIKISIFAKQHKGEQWQINFASIRAQSGGKKKYGQAFTRAQLAAHPIYKIQHRRLHAGGLVRCTALVVRIGKSIWRVTLLCRVCNISNMKIECKERARIGK